MKRAAAEVLPRLREAAQDSTSPAAAEPLAIGTTVPPDDGPLGYRAALLVDLACNLCRWLGQPVELRGDAADLLVVDGAAADSDATAATLAVAGARLEGAEVLTATAGWRISELLAAGSGPALRYFALTTRPTDCWVVSPTGLAAAEVALAGLQDVVRELAGAAVAPASRAGVALRKRFVAALVDGALDGPAALAVLWDTARADLPAGERLGLLLEFDRVLDLGLAAAARPPEQNLPTGADELIADRAAARAERDWARSDALRDRLAELGVESLDTPRGSNYRRR